MQFETLQGQSIDQKNVEAK